MNPAMKQTAITKHPERHGSFCIRLRFTDGATLEIVSHPQSFADLIANLEGQLVTLRRIEGKDPGVAVDILEQQEQRRP